MSDIPYQRLKCDASYLHSQSMHYTETAHDMIGASKSVVLTIAGETSLHGQFADEMRIMAEKADEWITQSGLANEEVGSALEECQRKMRAKQQLTEMLSNLLKQSADTQKSIIRNIQCLMKEHTTAEYWYHHYSNSPDGQLTAKQWLERMRYLAKKISETESALEANKRLIRTHQKAWDEAKNQKDKAALHAAARISAARAVAVRVIEACGGGLYKVAGSAKPPIW